MAFLERPILGQSINLPVCLAPMVGLTHVAFRLLVKSYCPPGVKTIWPTEMLNSRRLPNEHLGFTFETYRSPDEIGLVPQILGNEKEAIQKSVLKLQEWGAEGVDINMGCPVRKALRHNYGVALMGDADYAAEVVKMTVEASKLPVSVKLRAGLQNDEKYLVSFIKRVEASGASWITLHPRQASQGRRGNADWSQIERVRSQVSCAVIGNGDIQTFEDVLQMGRQTGCDAVMVGRALTARPWLLGQMAQYMGFKVPHSLPSNEYEEGEEFGQALMRLLKWLEQYFPLEPGLKRLHFFLKNAHPWLEFGHALTASISNAKTYEDAEQRIFDFFKVPQKMYQRTDLRY